MVIRCIISAGQRTRVTRVNVEIRLSLNPCSKYLQTLFGSFWIILDPWIWMSDEWISVVPKVETVETSKDGNELVTVTAVGADFQPSNGSNG